MTDIPDGTYTAVVDRIEDGLAALVVEGSETTVGELVVPPEELPEPARQADAVVTIDVIDGDLTAVSYDPEETDRRADRAQSRFDRLSSRPPSDDEE